MGIGGTHMHFDHQHISLVKEYEVRHWMRTIQCSQEELFDAVRVVGNDVEQVRHYRAEKVRQSWFAALGS
jgi:hypothetical protein